MNNSNSYNIHSVNAQDKSEPEYFEITDDGDTSQSEHTFLGRLFYESSKRFLDIFASLGILVFAAPLMLLLSIIIRLSSPGPAIFCQKRLTTGGRVFTIFKFRTMIPEAEVASGAVWASEGDPRVTRLGKFMRKTRLDELPQLINVLIGDMSLIGPRPERPELARKLQAIYPNFKKRHEVPAGLSGLAQVSSGYADSLESYKLKLAHDLTYIKNRSLLLDFKIAIRTIYVIISGHGAR